MRHSHFMCAVCYGGYIMRACSAGGVFEREIRNSAGVVISARGRLPARSLKHVSTPGSRSQALGLDVSRTDTPGTSF